MLSLYIEREEFFLHKEFPICGTMHPNDEYERQHIINVLESKGYKVRPSMRPYVGKYWWKCGYSEEGIRWKDWESNFSVFDEIIFQKMFDPNPEYHGYHIGKQYGI